ncbi:LytTR family DNA-binding domain-containing protein [Flavobacteriaceae bacterium F08102]|nr:LytTR family DNA-binding domain-containing protein [Flavobacteriaceae bacterium F08102]
MKVLIIEDEKPSARRLKRMLHAEEIEVIEMLHSVEEALAWFNTHEHPALIFLDIQLSDGLSFEIFEQIEINSAIIFTTAYDEYALQAFSLNSIDYLLKPIDQADLKKAVEKYKTRMPQQQKVAVNFDEIKRLLVNPIDRSFKKRFTIKIGQHLKMIPVEEIGCFYSEHKSTYLHTMDGRDYPIDNSLEALEYQLNPEVFFRISRKHFVNIQAIKDMVSYTNSRLQIRLHSEPKQELIVSRERVKDFKRWLE